MQTFKRYFRQKTGAQSFKAFYDHECHVCANTVRIFEKLERDHLDLAQVATELGVQPADLRSLRDADYCDPRLVIQLCRHLGLEPPESCPRL